MEQKQFGVSTFIIDENNNIIADGEGNPISKEESDRIKASSEQFTIPRIVFDAIQQAFPEGTRPKYRGMGIKQIKTIAISIEKETGIGRDTIRNEILKIPERNVYHRKIKKIPKPSDNTTPPHQVTPAFTPAKSTPAETQLTITENTCIWILAEIDKSGKIVQWFKNRKELN